MISSRGQRWGQNVIRRSLSNSKGGAGDGLRTRYLDLGKVALYQVSYSRSAQARGSILPGWAPPALRATSPQVGEELHINQAVWGSGHCVTRRPQRSRRAFTLIAESCSFVRSRRPDSTAALTAAIALTS